MSQDEMIREAAVLVGANIVVETCKGTSFIDSAKQQYVNLINNDFNYNDAIAITRLAMEMAD